MYSATNGKVKTLRALDIARRSMGNSDLEIRVSYMALAPNRAGVSSVGVARHLQVSL